MTAVLRIPPKASTRNSGMCHSKSSADSLREGRRKKRGARRRNALKDLKKRRVLVEPCECSVVFFAYHTTKPAHPSHLWNFEFSKNLKDETLLLYSLNWQKRSDQAGARSQDLLGMIVNNVNEM